MRKTRNKMSFGLIIMSAMLMALTIGCDTGPVGPERDIRNTFLEDLDSLDGDGTLALLQGLIYEMRKGETDRSASYLDELERNLLTRIDDNLTASEIDKINGMIHVVTPDHLDWALDRVLQHLEDLEIQS